MLREIIGEIKIMDIQACMIEKSCAGLVKYVPEMRKRVKQLLEIQKQNEIVTRIIDGSHMSEMFLN